MENRVSISTPEHVHLQYETAGIGSRGLAAAIDMLITFGLLIVMVLLSIPFFIVVEGTGWGSVTFSILLIVLFSTPILYWVLMEYFMKGQTLGKRTVGLRVVMDDGRTPTFFAVFLRNLLRLIDNVPFFYFLGMVVILFNKKEKRIGDLAAGTIVVREKKEKRGEMFLSTIPEKLELPLGTSSKYSKISDEQFLELEKFMARRKQLDPAQRQELARLFVDTLFSDTQVAEGEEEVFLEGALAELKQTRYLGL